MRDRVFTFFFVLMAAIAAGLFVAGVYTAHHFIVKYW